MESALCDIQVMGFLQSYVIMPGGRLRNLGRSSTWLRIKMVIFKVVAYEKRSLWESWLFLIVPLPIQNVLLVTLIDEEDI